MSDNPVRDLLAARLVRGWVRLYTSGLPAEVRDGRREEIDGDLWEQVRDAMEIGRVPRYLRSDVLVRWLLGVPADLSWRVAQGAHNGGDRPFLSDGILALHALKRLNVYLMAG